MSIIGFAQYPTASSSYTIVLDGKELEINDLYKVVNIEIVRTIFGANSCSITFLDGNFNLLNDTMWLAGKSVNVAIKSGKVVRGDYPSTDTSVNSNLVNEGEYTFSGFISVVDVDFPSDGLSQLTITCMDNTHLMNRKIKTRVWENKTITQVVNSVVSEYGFKCDITPTSHVYDTIEQLDMTDIAFIEELCKEVEYLGYSFYIEGETFYFKKKTYKQGDYHFAYRQAPYSLYTFNPRINKEQVQEPTTSTDLNMDTLEVEEWDEELDVPLNGDEQASNSLTKQGESSSATEFYLLTGTVVCEPHLKVGIGESIKLFGLGSVLSGDYFVEEIQYSVSEGGLTQSMSVSKTAFGESSGGNNEEEIEDIVEDVGVEYYTLVKGDTLWGLAKKFYGDGSLWTTIAEANTIEVNDERRIRTLQIGEKFVIPSR